MCAAHAAEEPRAVAQRAGMPTANATTAAPAARPTIASRVPTIRAVNVAVPVEEEVAVEEEPIVEAVVETIYTAPMASGNDRSNEFASMFEVANASTSTETSMAAAIRAQRAAIDAADIAAEARGATATLVGANANACDGALRKCMSERCGNDFQKCAGDGDTEFGAKLNTCNRNSGCSGREFSLFATEIKADRDANAVLSQFTEVINCGVEYNRCMLDRCGGGGYPRCLSKSGGDAAIAVCQNIATNCRAADSGLAARMMEVFGNLRVETERSIASWERQLYALRDQLSAICVANGGMFDTQSFDCVYTAEMTAQGWDHPVASKKLFAGQAFMCTPDWFGVDITTFKENAARLTRSQAGASSAMLGAGLGVAAGALSSGAISRAIDRHKAEKELSKELKKELPPPPVECEAPFVKDASGQCVCPNNGDPNDDCNCAGANVLQDGMCKPCPTGTHKEGDECKPDTLNCSAKGPLWTESGGECVCKIEISNLVNGQCVCVNSRGDPNNNCECANGGIMATNCRCPDGQAEISGVCGNCPNGQIPNDNGIGCKEITACTPEQLANGYTEFTRDGNKVCDCKPGLLENLTVTPKRCEEMDKMSVKTDGLFNSGQFVLKETAAANLANHIATLININKKAAELNSPICFIIVGHTDKVPVTKPTKDFKDNQGLSERRAESIAKLLALSPTNITNTRTFGRGEAECTSAKRDDPNCRRVDIYSKACSCAEVDSGTCSNMPDVKASTINSATSSGGGKTTENQDVNRTSSSGGAGQMSAAA
ncbi:MAG: OmpA family protein, partial [Alphaproteobacteria bacterium]|nr:OmpA family protein [Alphaproteobacteria bacterium]